MAYQNAWQQITGIGDPTRTAAIETNLLDKQNQLVQQGNKNIADLFTGLGQSDANRIAAEAKSLFNTGNPLIDNRNRIEYGEGQLGIHSPSQLSKLFGAQLKTDQDTVQSEAKMFDQVKTMRDSQKVTGQMGESDWSNPLNLTQQSLDWTDNANNNVNQSALTNKMVDTIANQSGYQFNPENIFESMAELGLDKNDKKSYTGTVETAAINRAADSLQKNYQGLPREVAIAASTKLLGKTKYAGEFARGKVAEGKRTIATDKVEAISNELVNAANLDPKLATTYKSKVTAVNNALKHVARTSNMPKEDQERWDKQVMTVLDSMNLIPGSGAQGRFGETESIFNGLFQDKDIKDKDGTVIGVHTALQQAKEQKGRSGTSLVFQARFKDIIRKRLKNPETGFPQLPDRIIDAHIDKLVASDPALGPAFTRGKFLAAEKTKLTTQTIEATAATQLADNQVVNAINQTGGNSPDFAIKATLEKLQKKGVFDGSEESLEDQAKLRDQFEGAYRKVRTSFLYKDPKTGEQVDLLDDQGLDAFNLAFYKMATNKVRVQKDAGLLGFRAWFKADIDVEGVGGDLSKRDARDVLRIMMQSVPNKASDAMKTNIRSFKRAVNLRKKAIDSGIETENMVQQRLRAAALDMATPDLSGSSASQAYIPSLDIKNWPQMFKRFTLTP